MTAVALSSSLPSTEAPESKSNSATAHCWWRSATIRGVPLTLTESNSTAPLLTRRWTRATWPCWAARWSIVSSVSGFAMDQSTVGWSSSASAIAVSWSLAAWCTAASPFTSCRFGSMSSARITFTVCGKHPITAWIRAVLPWKMALHTRWLRSSLTACGPFGRASSMSCVTASAASASLLQPSAAARTAATMRHCTDGTFFSTGP
mmetsp:Transcript_15499/g.60622  ORF Transcript_15499/g.60622 Transcript_15499/m.60622 type:complete len:205 (-) Transcript_15499:326-940(-)